MRIVAFSDSHHNFFTLKNIVNSRTDADLFLFLGDGERDFNALKALNPSRKMYGVRGNCDLASAAPEQDMLFCANKHILFTHGHLFGVKAGLDALRDYAHETGADVVLYGHTHIAHTGYHKGLYLMNPGSVALPVRGGTSYGVLDITDAGVSMNIVPL